MRAGTLVGACLTTTLFLAAASAPTAQHALPRSAYLDSTAIAEAILFGEKQSPHPYMVPMPGWPEPNIAVYTPFMRVALTASVAERRGGRATAESLPEWVTRPEVHVVVKWPHNEPTKFGGGGALFHQQMKMSQIGLMPIGRFDIFDFVRPNWMTTDLSYLDTLGGAPFANAAAAAAFPAESFVSGMDVYGWWQVDRDYLISPGRIDQAVYATLR
jgi:hypothetical protein